MLSDELLPRLTLIFRMGALFCDSVASRNLSLRNRIVFIGPHTMLRWKQLGCFYRETAIPGLTQSPIGQRSASLVMQFGPKIFPAHVLISHNRSLASTSFLSEVEQENKAIGQNLPCSRRVPLKAPQREIGPKVCYTLSLRPHVSASDPDESLHSVANQRLGRRQ